MKDWRNDLATDRQQKYAAQLGIQIPTGATKGQASDIISNAESKAEPTQATYSATIDLNTQKGGILSRIFNTLTGSATHNKHDYMPEPRHAKSGTFDAEEFVNPKTGRFQFPKYKHNPEYLINIVDNTDYRGDIWDNLDSSEKRVFSLRDFEFEFCSADIEVDDFKTFFNKPGNHYLGDLKVLRENFELIDELLYAMESDELCCLDGYVEKSLTDGGYVYVRDFVCPQDKRLWYGSFTVPVLKELAKGKGLKVNGKKVDLVDRMVESGYQFDFPQAYVPSPKFYEWLDAVADGYIAEIKRNAKRFHPLYHEDIWLAVDDSGLDIIGEKVKTILATKYWESMLTA